LKNSGDGATSEELTFHFDQLTVANGTGRASWDLLKADSEGPPLPSGMTFAPLPVPIADGLSLELSRSGQPTETIALDSFSLLLGSEFGAGPRLNVAAALCNSSPDLFQALTTGRTYDTAVLRETNSSGQVDAVWVMSHASVADDTVSSASQGTTESLTFGFAQITEGVDAESASWDVAKAVAQGPPVPSSISFAPFPVPVNHGLTLQLSGMGLPTENIALEDFQFHISSSSSTGGEPLLFESDVTADLSDASPDLLRVVTGGLSYDKAVLTETNALGPDDAAWVMKDITIRSDVLSSSGDGVAKHNLNLSFAQITEANGAGNASWDLTKADAEGPLVPTGLSFAPLPVPADHTLTLQLSRAGQPTETIALDRYQFDVQQDDSEANEGTLDVKAALSGNSPDFFKALTRGLAYDTAVLEETNASGQIDAAWVMSHVVIREDTQTNRGDGTSAEDLSFQFDQFTEANSAQSASWNLAANVPAGPAVPAGVSFAPLPVTADEGLTLQRSRMGQLTQTIILDSFQFNNDLTRLQVSAALTDSSPVLSQAAMSGLAYDTADLEEKNSSGQVETVWVLCNVSVIDNGSAGDGTGVLNEFLAITFDQITKATGAGSASRDMTQGPPVPTGLSFAPAPVPVNHGLTLQLSGLGLTTENIALDGFQFGFQNPVQTGSGGLSTAGIPNLSDLDVTAAISEVSPALFKSLANRLTYHAAVLTEMNASGQTVAVWALENVRVSGDVPQDIQGLSTVELTFHFDQLTEATGSGRASWDVLKADAEGPPLPSGVSFAPLARYAPVITISAGPFTYDGTTRAATATATALDRTALSGDFSFTYYTGTVASGTGTSTAPAQAGKYTVIAHFHSTDPNYSDGNSAPLTFAIAKATLTITADNQTKIAAEANPAFTVSYSGFISGEGPALLGGALTFSTPATAGSPPGAYAIVPAGLNSTDYAITFVNGTLIVLSTTQATTSLVSLVDSGGLANDIRQSLDNQLQAPLDSIKRGNQLAAANQLAAFANHFRAQSGKQIDPVLANTLLVYAQRIAEVLGGR